MRKKMSNKTFYDLLKESGQLHSVKMNEESAESFEFAGMLSKLFTNASDAGFVARVGEKLFKLAKLENEHKIEGVAEVEKELCVVMILWLSARKDRRITEVAEQAVVAST
jgi:hypothetical protein